MKRLILICLLPFLACKKSSSSSSNSKDQITYEVKVPGVSLWYGNYLDATGSFTLLNAQTTTSWSITFANSAATPRFLQMQVTAFTPANPLSVAPLTLISTIYVNGRVVKSDTASGRSDLITPPFAQYNLLK